MPESPAKYHGLRDAVREAARQDDRPSAALIEQAERAGHGRVGLLLEGGYDLLALKQSVSAVTRAMLGEGRALPEDKPSAEGRLAVERTRAALAPIWNLDAPVGAG